HSVQKSSSHYRSAFIHPAWTLIRKVALAISLAVKQPLGHGLMHFATQLRMRIDLLLHLVEVRTDGIGQSVCSSRRKVRSRRLPCGVIGAENEMQGQVVKCPRWIGKLRVIPLAVGEWSETGSNNLGLRIDGTDCLTERERARPDVAYCFVADLPMAVELVAQFVDNVTFMMRVNVAD